ncbi:hypothetical protein [Gottfriedia solisilvae]|uniref:hypothetical protein n=1 Tax=Gottfriedia solisilvae TaxID=1516104 RepID=UPI003D2F3F2C
MILNVLFPLILFLLIIGIGYLLVKLFKRKINIFLKLLLVVIGTGVIAIYCFIWFIVSTWIADPQEMEIAVSLAEEYIIDTNRDNVELKGSYFDDGGVFPFEYAANAKNTKDQTEFFIYFNDRSQRMEDSYVAKKWENELRKNTKGYIKQKLKKIDKIYIKFDESVGYVYQVDPNQPSSYKNYDATPSIDIEIPRKKKEDDIRLFNEILTFLQNEEKLTHAKLSVTYMKDGVLVENEIWEGSF